MESQLSGVLDPGEEVQVETARDLNGLQGNGRGCKCKSDGEDLPGVQEQHWRIDSVFQKGLRNGKPKYKSYIYQQRQKKRWICTTFTKAKHNFDKPV